MKINDSDKLFIKEIDSTKKRILLDQEYLRNTINILKNRLNELFSFNSYNQSIINKLKFEESVINEEINNRENEKLSRYFPPEGTGTDKKKIFFLKKKVVNKIFENEKITNMINEKKEFLKSLNKSSVEKKERNSQINLLTENLKNFESGIVNVNHNKNKLIESYRDEVIKYKNILLEQEYQLSEINETLLRYGSLQADKDRLREKRRRSELIYSDIKNKIKEKIKNANDNYLTQKNTDILSIKMIFGLYLIQKYLLINPKEFSNSVYESVEYKILMNECLRNENQKILKIIINNESIRFSYNNKTFSYDVNAFVSMFHFITIDYSHFEDFHQKITSIQKSNQKFISIYNEKQIKLDLIKEKYMKKVKKILSLKYKHIQDIIQSNSKIKKFIDKYKENKNRISISENNLYTFEYKVEEMFVEKIKAVLETIHIFLEGLKLTSLNLSENFNEKIRLFLENQDNLSKTKIIEAYLKEFSKINSFNDLIFKKFDLDDMINFILKEGNILNLIEIKLYKSVFTLFSKESVFLEIIGLIKDLLIKPGELLLRVTPHNLSSENINFTQKISSRKVMFKSKFNSNFSLNHIKLEKNEESDQDSLNEEVFSEKIKNENHLTKQNSTVLSIIKNQYEPFIKKKKYFIDLNRSMKIINQKTSESKKDNYQLSIKKKQLQRFSKEIRLFSNPNNNLSSISKNTYSQLIKRALNSNSSDIF